MRIHQFCYLSDNYGVLLHCPHTNETAAIDAGDSDAYIKAASEAGWTITQIWVTHHHGDHVAGLAELLKATGAKLFAPKSVSTSSNNAETLDHDDRFEFAGTDIEIIATPGHTLDMLNYYVSSESLLFSGDTLFTLGCGRLFEGHGEMMWNSLSRLMALPDETIIYSSHEYSLANAAFAVSVDPDNALLLKRQEEIQALRDNNEPTVPSTLSLEKQTNPFLRASDPHIRAHLGMTDASDADVFSEIRRRKDSF